MILKRVEPLSYGKVLSVMFSIAGLIIGLIGAIVIVLLSNLPTLLPGMNMFGSHALSNHSLSALSNFALLLPILGLVFGAIFGLMHGTIFSFLYNFVALKMGGVKLNLSKDKKTLQNVDPASAGKVYGTITAIVGGIVALMIGTIVGGIVGLVVGLIAGVIVGGLLGLIVAALVALLYNLLAGWIGGIKVAFSDNLSVLSWVDIISYAKILALIEGLVGLIRGLFAILVVHRGIEFLLLNVIGSLVAGFIVGMIIALLYNFAAKKVGGVVVSFSK